MDANLVILVNISHDQAGSQADFPPFKIDGINSLDNNPMAPRQLLISDSHIGQRTAEQ
jgi:hypothetical protein